MAGGGEAALLTGTQDLWGAGGLPESKGPEPGGGRWLIFMLQECVHSLMSGMPTSRPSPQPASQLDQIYWHLFQRGHLKHWSGLEDAEKETFLQATGDLDYGSF